MTQHVEHLSGRKEALAQEQTPHCHLSLSSQPQRSAVGMMLLADSMTSQLLRGYADRRVTDLSVDLMLELTIKCISACFASGNVWNAFMLSLVSRLLQKVGKHSSGSAQQDVYTSQVYVCIRGFSSWRILWAY